MAAESRCKLVGVDMPLTHLLIYSLFSSVLLGGEVHLLVFR